MTETATLKASPTPGASRLNLLNNWDKELRKLDEEYLTNLSFFNRFINDEKPDPNDLTECLRKILESHVNLRNTLNNFPPNTARADGTNPFQDPTSKICLVMKDLIDPFLPLIKRWESDDESDLTNLVKEWNQLKGETDFSKHLKQKRENYRSAWRAVDNAVVSIRDQHGQVDAVQIDNEKKYRLNNGWYKAEATPPSSHPYCSKGTQPEFTEAVAHTQANRGERTLQDKLKREASSYWGRKMKNNHYEIWFSSKTKYDECQTKLSEIRNRPTR